MHDSRDRELGMHRKITRRDFLNGVAVTAGAAMMPWDLSAAGFGQAAVGPESSPNYYPPALTGMRGSHPGSFDAAHALRDGTFWDTAGKPEDTGETYDLIIVGGGISGLAAAHFYRKATGNNARILILENHDDFGGHAKRNEFRVGNAFRLGFGGTFSIESPAPYSAVAKAVIEELGIDVSSYPKYVNKSLYPSAGLRAKVFFDKETFGVDKLVVNPSPRGGGESEDAASLSPKLLTQFLAEAPLAEQAKRDLVRLQQQPKDYYPGLTSDQKKAKLARISYAKFLTDVAGVHEDIVKYYQTLPHGLFGVGIDAVSAQDAWGFDLPGFDGLKLDPTPGKGMNRDAIPNEEAEKYFFHFPDGNATIARLLVRRLDSRCCSRQLGVGCRASESELREARRLRFIRAHSPEQHGGPREAPWRRGQRQGGGSDLRARRQGLYRQGEEFHPGVLACSHPIHLRRAAGQAEGSVGLGAESSVTLHQRRAAQLDLAAESGRQFHLCAGHVPLVREPRLASQHGRIRVLRVSLKSRSFCT